MTEKKKVTVGFQLQNIKTEQFATIKEAYKEDSQVSIKIGFNFGIFEEEKGLSCTAHVEFQSDERPFIIAEVRCDFGIKPETWDELIDSAKHQITFPGQFLQHMAVLTIGTTRGVLHAKTEDTSFGNMLMPTLDITKMVNKPMSFDLEPKSESTA